MSKGIRKGFSKPYIASYNIETGAYTNGMILARGVDMSASVDVSDAENWYADNVIAETSGARFVGGSLAITADDPDTNALALLYSPTTNATDGTIDYVQSQQSNRVGFGAVVKKQYQGTEFYEFIIFPNVAFQPIEETAETETDSVNWQTITLNADIGVDTRNRWKRLSNTTYETEAEAYSAMIKILGAE